MFVEIFLLSRSPYSCGRCDSKRLNNDFGVGKFFKIQSNRENFLPAFHKSSTETFLKNLTLLLLSFAETFLLHPHPKS